MPGHLPHFPTIEGMYAHLRVSPPHFAVGSRIQTMCFEDFDTRSRSEMPVHTRGYYQAALIDLAGARRQRFGSDSVEVRGSGSHRLFFVGPNHAYSWRRAKSARGPILKFYADALPALPGSIEEVFPYFDIRLANAFELTAERAEQVTERFAFVARAARSSGRGTWDRETGGHALASLLYACMSDYEIAESAIMRSCNAAQLLLARFTRLLSRRFAEERSVSYYADALGISTGHLRDVVRELTGLSPSARIAATVTAEARRMLTVEDMRPTEVAYALGFSSPSHFGRYFRRHVGEEPGALRASVDPEPML